MGKGGTEVPDLISEHGKQHLAWSAGGLVAAILGLGCLATGAQVHVVREFLTMFAGDELSIAVVFSCWLAGVTLGAASGAKVAPHISNPWNYLVASGMAGSVLFPILLISLRFIGEIPGAPSAGQIPSAGSLTLTGLCFITPAAFFMGFAFPLACRAASANDSTHLSVGRVYVLESIGAIIGGVAVSMVLPRFTNALASITILSLPLLIGISLASRRRAKILSLLSAVFSLVLVLLIATGTMAKLDDVSTGWRFGRVGIGHRVAWADTPYQHLDLSLSGGQYNLFAQGKISSSFPDHYTARPRAHMVLLQHPDPKDVLVLGPSFAEFAPAALSHPIHRLDIVELDPGVLRLLEPFLPPDDKAALADKRVHVHMTDGRRFLNQSDGSWDLIFSDSPDPTTSSINRFFTREFFSMAKAHLKGGGVFCTRVSSVVNLQGMETGSRLRTIELTMSSVFKNVLLVPGQETFLFATDKPRQLLDDPIALEKRMAANKVKDPKFFPQQLEMLVQTELIVDLAKRLQAMGPRPLNTDDRPVTYLQSIEAWSKMTKDPAGSIIKALKGLPWWFWFALSSVLLALSGLLVYKRASSSPGRAVVFASSVSIGIVGASGMALELVLSYAYQSIAGSLYQELGLIVAAFMGGLVAAGAITQRSLKHHRATRVSLMITLWAFASFAALLPLFVSSQILQWFPMYLAQAWILMLVIFTGAFTGTSFPLAAALALGFTRQAGATGGKLDAWDHSGAGISVLFAGLVFIPMLGRIQTCILLALWCVLAGVTIWITWLKLPAAKA